MWQATNQGCAILYLTKCPPQLYSSHFCPAIPHSGPHPKIVHTVRLRERGRRLSLAPLLYRWPKACNWAVWRYTPSKWPKPLRTAKYLECSSHYWFKILPSACVSRKRDILAHMNDCCVGIHPLSSPWAPRPETLPEEASPRKQHL